MRTIASTLVLGALLASVAACGGEDATSAPPQAPAPPPPVAPPADTTPPPPVAEAPPAPAPSLNDKMMATMKVIGDAMNAHDTAKIAAAYTPDASMKAAGMPATTGNDAVVAEWKRVFEEFPDAKFGSRRVFVKDDTAILEWTMTGTNTGPAPMGAKSTGKPIGFYGVSVMSFNNDGLVKEERAYWDMPTMMGQLGMAPKGTKAREVAKLPDGPPEVHVAKGTPTETANVDKAKSVQKAFETHDEKVFLDANADDVVWDDFSMPAATNGKKEVQKNFEMSTKAFPDMKMDCATWGFDDYVVEECTMNATSKGAIEMGPGKKIAPTNKPVSFHGVDVITIKDGKATKGWSYGNGMELAMQMGLMPAQTMKAPHQPKRIEDAKAPVKDVAKAPAKDTAKAPKK